MLQPEQFGKHWGGGMESLFPEGSAGKTTPPFPAAGRSKRQMPYDEEAVHKHLRGTPETELIDPRTLHSTQSWVTREATAHYMKPENRARGALFANAHEPGNQTPVIYSRHEGEGREPTHMILSGHHRATAALLQGRQFVGTRVEGGWGREH